MPTNSSSSVALVASLPETALRARRAGSNEAVAAATFSRTDRLSKSLGSW